jgi:hypothetical protein
MINNLRFKLRSFNTPINRYLFFGSTFVITSGIIGNRAYNIYNERQRYNYYHLPKFTKKLENNPNYIYVDASGLSEAEVLKELYDFACPLGNGKSYYKDNSMTLDEATKIFIECEDRNNHFYFNTLNNRLINTDFKDFPILNSVKYNEFHGPNAMQKCINKLKNKKNIKL